MKFSSILLASLVQADQLFEEPKQMIINQDIVDKIKTKTDKWTAHDIEKNPLKNLTTSQFISSLGKQSTDKDLQNQEDQQIFNIRSKMLENMKHIGDLLQNDKHPKVKEGSNEIIRGDTRLPNKFNLRDAYKMCNTPIHDQGLCGASWAFASSGMLADRFCIQSKGQIQVDLSAQDMINCNFENLGCQGGSMVRAVEFLQAEGTSSTSCNKYQEQLQKCQFQCDNPKKQAYDKFYCAPKSLRIETDIVKIQQDIYENGPVMLSMLVYEDFPNYEAGVYERTTGKLTGGQIVRGIGWGHTKDGHLYWIVQNQWGEEWGINGTAMIKAGEVGIDTWAISCNPDIKVQNK